MYPTYSSWSVLGDRASNSRGLIRSHRLLFSFHDSVVNFPFTKRGVLAVFKHTYIYINKIFTKRIFNMNHIKFAIACVAIFVGASIATQYESAVTGNAKDSSLILRNLLDGNARYVSGNTTSRNLPEDRGLLAAGQSPAVVVIRCADSRVAPEIVFDQELGDLFVCGVAGNVPTPEIIGSIEYAVAVLGSEVIVVMGHSSCGAVSAAMGILQNFLSHYVY